MIASWWSRLHRDHPGAFIPAMLVTGTVAACGIACLYVGAVVLYFDADRSQVGAIAPRAFLPVLLGLALSFVLDRRHLLAVHRAVVHPSAGRATVDFRRLARTPLRACTVALVPTVLGELLFLVPYVVREFDLGAAGIVSTILLVIVAAGSCWVLVVFFAEWNFRPAIEAAAAFLPQGWRPTRTRWTLQVKLLVGTVALTTATAALAAALVPADATSQTRFVWAIVTGIGIAVLFAVPGALLLSGAINGPVAALVRATVRVRRGDLEQPVPVSSLDELGEVVVAFNEMQRGLRERLALHDAVSRYVDPVVAHRVLAGTDDVAEAAIASVMFVDLVRFTAYAEAAAPEDVIATLNRFFELVVPCIEEHGGHVNKLLGDGVLAVFGAPDPLANHADAALAAGLEIAERASRPGVGIELGVGINTGRVVIGCMGGGTKRDYTLIGDVVNVAARVEAMTRITGDPVLLTEDTRLLLSHPPELQPRGPAVVKGRANPVVLYAAERTRPTAQGRCVVA